MFLAIKEMQKEKSRFILIICIVVLISYLIFFLTGLAYGLAKDNVTAVEMWNANKIVLKSGANSNLSASMMDKKSLEDFSKYDISPINLARVVAYKNSNESKENTINIAMIGLNQDSKAYPEVIEGNKPQKNNEVLASISLRNEKNINIGDKLLISMNNKEYEVVGFTNESKYNVSSVIYTELNESSANMLSFVKDDSNENKNGTDATSGSTKSIPERISGILVHGENDLKSNNDYDVIDINEFIKEIPGYLAQVLTFGLMIGFLIIISTIVLGVFMYIITIQKKQTFGIMKVQGISNTYIAKSVINQTFLVSVFGVLIGLGLNLLSEIFLPNAVPFKSNNIFYVSISIVIVLTSLIGAIFSVRGVTKVDPLEVLD